MTTRRRGSAGKRITRSRRSGGQTVASLQASFERMDNKVRAAIEKGHTDSDLAVSIEKMWRDLFQDDLSAAAVKGMVSHYRAVTGSKVGSGKQRRTRKQRGGMAPLDWMMGQGTTAPTYGQFPVPISELSLRAFDNTMFPESSVGRSCNSVGGLDTLAGQRGGGTLDAVLNAHPPQSVPPNGLQVAVNTLQGSPVTFPSASPVAASVPLAVATPQPYDATRISAITNLASVYTGY